MEIRFTEAETSPTFPRIYGIDAILRNFKGCPHLEITIIRHGQTKEEVEALLGKGLVGEPDPEVPKEVLVGATEYRALQCLLENFTKEEAQAFVDYVQERYADQVEAIMVGPLDIPIPLGAGPLAALPITKNSGFICFDKAENYPLPFAARAYFDFSLQDELS
ncbi:MAG: hypothetical protein IJS54_02990 [Desulfovibrio sp.]|nr:hypothetical protein [Desulfovibrio sp.]